MCLFVFTNTDPQCLPVLCETALGSVHSPSREHTALPGPALLRHRKVLAQEDTPTSSLSLGARAAGGTGKVPGKVAFERL